MKEDEESNGLIEKAVMMLRGIIRTTKCHIESSTQEPTSDKSPVLPWLMEHAGCILSRCQEGRDGKRPFGRLHGKKPTQEFVPFGQKVLAKQITTDPMNRTNPRYQYGIWLGMRNNKQRRMVRWECRWCLRSSRNHKIGTTEQMGHRNHQQCDWSTLETRSLSGPYPNPSVAI